VAGRSLLATGANPWAAELAGLPVKRNVILSHSISGLLAGIAGILVVLRVGAALPSTGGDWVLDSFAIPIIGGTALAGGGVSAFGAVLGALLLLLIRNGLLLVGIGGWWIQLLSGMALLAAVLLDRWRTRVIGGAS
jgi:ribose transport system permease protein